MGKLETENNKEIRATKIQKIVLRTIATAGILSVALLAPNALQMLKFFNINKSDKRNKERSIYNSRNRLIEKGLIQYSGKGSLTLTLLGKKVLNKFENRDFKIKKPEKWDKKWRVLIFDIKEAQRTTRDNIRRTLISIGFVKLQNSVWVYPYDCEDLVNLLKTDFGIGREVLYIIADKIENEQVLIDNFQLK